MASWSFLIFKRSASPGPAWASNNLKTSSSSPRKCSDRSYSKNRDTSSLSFKSEWVSFTPTETSRLRMFRAPTSAPWWPWVKDHRNFSLFICLLYTSDAADDLLCVDLGGRRIIKKKKKKQ